MCIDMFLYWYILRTSLQRRYLLILPATWSSSQEIGLFSGASVLEMMHIETWYIYNRKNSLWNKGVKPGYHHSSEIHSVLWWTVQLMSFLQLCWKHFLLFFYIFIFSESEIIESCRNCLQWRERDCVDYSLTPKGVIFVYL